MVRFPSGDNFQHVGWNETREVAMGSTYVLGGCSVWEISAQRARIGQKAEDDYRKRAADPLGIDPAQTIYIFVTPQHWPQKDR